MLVPKVRLFFQPTGAGPADAIVAANQHVYLDLAPGVMAHLKTDATGTLAGVAPTPAAVSLDDTRTYHVVVSPTALPAPPAATSGPTAKVASAKLTVPPHIAIKVTTNGTTPAANLACTLTVGTTSTSVKTTTGGWITANDQSTGAVTLVAAGKLLRVGATSPAAKLSCTPAAPTRGDSATIAISAPTGTVGLKVTQWQCDVSHTNPAATAASTANIVRPATESPNTFDQNWQGVLCASGTIRAKFTTGVSLRTAGNAALAATVTAVDPVEVTLDVKVAARTGANWESKLVEQTVGELKRPLAKFHDTGEHNWKSKDGMIAPDTIAAGPNRGCQFVKTAAVTFVSSPVINSLLSDANSTFSQAQDKAYLVKPAPVRVIPRNLYNVGANGVISEKTPGAIGDHFGFGEGVMMSVSAHCIDQAKLLAGTRRHEFEDPGGKSHKGNCLKARRALEPVKFVEALVKTPGSTANLQTLFQQRVNLVLDAAPTHDIIDEAKTRTDNALRFVSGDKIANVNADSTGKMIAPVWNPTANTELTN